MEIPINLEIAREVTFNSLRNFENCSKKRRVKSIEGTLIDRVEREWNLSSSMKGKGRQMPEGKKRKPWSLKGFINRNLNQTIKTVPKLGALTLTSFLFLFFP